MISFLRKIEGLIFYLLIFSIPFQARIILHKWTEPFNQWTSAYVYGTDVLLFVVLIFWLKNFFVNLKKTHNDKTTKVAKISILDPGFWLWILLGVFAISILNSIIVGLSFYELIKFIEFLGFYLYIKSNYGSVYNFKRLALIVVGSGLLQALIGIIQYIKQGSLGLGFLGESPLIVGAPGVAVFVVDGEKYLRAYALTPHPNILAAWLFVSIVMFIVLCISKSGFKFNKPMNLLMSAAYAVITFGFFLTFSRVIIGLWFICFVLSLILIFLKNKSESPSNIRERLKGIVLLTIIIVGVFTFLFWPQVASRVRVSSQEEAVTQRIFYNKIAGTLASENLWFGKGIGQFVPDFMRKFSNLPRGAYQPVHNVYLLLLSETGSVGLGVFMIFLFFVFYKFILYFRASSQFRDLVLFCLVIPVFCLLVVGLFDHFLWTSQQGSLVFWMLLGLIQARF